MSKSLTFQCVRSHEVIFNPNEGLCPKAILEWIQWIGLSLIQSHLLWACECLLLLPVQWLNNSLSLFCNVGFAHVCRSPPRRWHCSTPPCATVASASRNCRSWRPRPTLAAGPACSDQMPCIWRCGCGLHMVTAGRIIVSPQWGFRAA